MDIESLLKAFELKDEKRTGWELRNIEDPETVAGHSWAVTLLTLVYGQKEVEDLERALKIALVHDIGEAEIGDIPKRAVDVENEVSEDEKHKQERETVKELFSVLNLDLDLWEEYESRATSEARFVKDMDLIDMCLQALKYEKQGRYDKEEDNPNFQEYNDMDEFFATSETRLRTEKGKQLFEKIKSRYEEAKQQ